MSYGRPREMHYAVCAECGQKCQVPFKADQCIAENATQKEDHPEEIDIKLTS